MKGVELNKKYTYAQMCEIFECEQKKGTCSRNSQLKEWEAICKIDRPCKGKYVILEIYSEPKEVDNQKGRKPKYLPYTEPLLLSMLNDALVLDENGKQIKIGTFTYAELRTEFFDLRAKDFYINDKLKKAYNFVNNQEKLTEWANDVEKILREKTKKVIRDNTLKLLNNKECYNIDFNYLRLRTGKNAYDIRDMNLNELIEKKERIWCEYHNRCSFTLNKKDRIAMQNYVIEQLRDRLEGMGFDCQEVESYQKAIKIKYTSRVKKELQQEVNRIRAELRYLVYSEIFSSKIDVPKEKNKTKNYEISFKIEYFLSITNLFGEKTNKNL